MGIPFHKLAHNGALYDRIDEFDKDRALDGPFSVNNIILEAEIVPWNEDVQIVDEFYHLASLRRLPHSTFQTYALLISYPLIFKFRIYLYFIST